MKKIIIAVLIIAPIITLISNEWSYSFIKKIFTINPPTQESLPNADNEFIDIEDMIYIPPIKNFKEYFLNKINSESYIEVIIPQNVLYFYQFDAKLNSYRLLKKYPVAVGKPKTHTPIGEGMIYTKGPVVFKYLYGKNQGKIIEKGHDEQGEEFDMPYESIFAFFMVINQSDKYIIHSTTESWRIGQAISGGCVRMLIPDMLDLYPFVTPPMRVQVRYQLFYLDQDLVTVYPDIYHYHTDLYTGLMEFLKINNINPIIFDMHKIRAFLMGDLPDTVSLNNFLDDYFVKRNIKFNDIQVDENNFLGEYKKYKINAFVLPNQE